MPGKEVAVWLITDFLVVEGTEERGGGVRWVTDYLQSYCCLVAYLGSAVRLLALAVGSAGLGDLVRVGMIVRPWVFTRELPELISC